MVLLYDVCERQKGHRRLHLEKPTALLGGQHAPRHQVPCERGVLVCAEYIVRQEWVNRIYL